MARLRWIALLALGCAPPASEAELTIDASVSEHDNNPVALWMQLHPTEAVTGEIEVWIDGVLDHTTPSVSLDDSAELPVLGLVPGAEIGLRFVGETPDGSTVSSTMQTTHTNDVDDEFPQIVVNDVTGDWPGGEAMCTNICSSPGCAIGCIDRQGRLRMVLMEPEGRHVVLVHRLQSGGYVGMLEGGELQLWDQTGTPTSTLGPDLSGTRFVHDSLDAHEIIEIDSGPWAGAFAVLSNTTDVARRGDVTGQGIVVIDPDNAEVLWDWSIHGQLGDGETIAPDKLDYDRVGLNIDHFDWSHANALLYDESDEGGFFWMSLRHQDWIIKIDVATDEVVWRFGRGGDFLLVDDLDEPTEVLGDHLFMYQQHAPEWTGDSSGRPRFVVYDNGMNRMAEDGRLWDGEPYSRLVEYQLDEDQRLAAVSFDYGSPEADDPEHFYGALHGDVDLLPDGDALMFVRHGSRPFIAEVGFPDGVLRWKATFDDEHQSPYRVEHHGSLY